jgi:CHAD domain-containing protein
MIGEVAMTRQREVERTYTAPASGALPTLTGLPGVTGTRERASAELVATYLDTINLDLARRQTSLRRRTGGDDAGWHLKRGIDRETRTELHHPLGEVGEGVPPGLLDQIRALARDHPLVPVATVRTHRLEYELYDAAGVTLAKVCDDQVHAERLVGPALVQEWHEWEIELACGNQELFDAVERRLVRAGGTRAAGASKLLRALGDLAPSRPAPLTRRRLSRASAATLLQAQLAEQVAALHRQDARVRAGRSSGVHKLRIATRRLRSSLTTYRSLLEASATDPVRDDLRWLGQSLGAARDAQVLLGHLRALVAREPVELVMGPVVQRLERELGAESASGLESALETLHTERYYRLLDALDGIVAAPPVAAPPAGALATASARAVVPRLLQRDARRLRRAVRRLRDADHAASHDALLHEVRKRAKHLRYGAEGAVPLFGARAKRLAAAAERVQETLGEHQDSVVAREKLREYAARAFLSGENGFTFGRLHAMEQWRAEESERRFALLWPELPRKRVRRYLRG